MSCPGRSAGAAAGSSGRPPIICSPEARIELPAVAATPNRSAGDGWTDASDAAAVMEQVQRRAAEDRRAARRGTLDAGV
jgi:hypothetical protein